MALHTESVEEKQSILIVGKDHLDLIHLLKKELAKYDINLFVSPDIPNKLDTFDYCFILNHEPFLKHIESIHFKKIIFLFTNHTFSINRWNDLHRTLSNHNTVKLVTLQGNDYSKEMIDKLLWFAFSKDGESLLSLSVRQKAIPQKITSNAKEPPMHKPHFGKKNIIFFILFLFILFHLLFLPFLGASFFYLYKSVQFLKSEQGTLAEESAMSATVYNRTAKILYSLSRPTYLMFSLALPIDNAFSLNDNLLTAVTTSNNVYKQGLTIINLILKKDKSEQEKALLKKNISLISEELPDLEDAFDNINQSLPDFANRYNLKDNLTKASSIVSKIKMILSHSDSLLAAGTKKTYLILFANNMELRPGGGFIGSFGILTVHDYTVDDLKVYDVYDADGQLDVHVDPPDAIRTYLHQPHYFLRDSAFYPDFEETYKKAQFFLDREMHMTQFDGGILVTTTAIQNLLGPFGDIYLPDFKEIVNDKNFYLKAQLHSEKDFFPGSIQKKGFLAALARYLILHASEVSPRSLGEALFKSLDEKQIAAYFEDSNIQSIFDSNYWSGRQIRPKCTQNIQNCIVDYLYTLDANLGVNKANFYVKKTANLQSLIDQNGMVRHTLVMHYTNESPAEVFPGGTYKNYFQIVLPTFAELELITKNGTLIENIDEHNDEVKTVGFYFELKPKEVADIKISYHLTKPLAKGKGLYQLVVQKQIGSPNSDLVLQFRLPTNITLLNQNFAPLVKDNVINYNTILSGDKIFFIDLLKQ